MCSVFVRTSGRLTSGIPTGAQRFASKINGPLQTVEIVDIDSLFRCSSSKKVPADQVKDLSFSFLIKIYNLISHHI